MEPVVLPFPELIARYIKLKGKPSERLAQAETATAAARWLDRTKHAVRALADGLPRRLLFRLSGGGWRDGEMLVGSGSQWSGRPWAEAPMDGQA